jgi:hypothetical protein
LKNIVPFQTYTYYLGYNPFPKESTTHGIEDGRDIALVGDHDSLTSHLGNMLIDLLQDRQVLFLQVASSLAKDPEYPRKDHNISKKNNFKFQKRGINNSQKPSKPRSRK